MITLYISCETAVAAEQYRNVGRVYYYTCISCSCNRPVNIAQRTKKYLNSSVGIYSNQVFFLSHAHTYTSGSNGYWLEGESDVNERYNKRSYWISCSREHARPRSIYAINSAFLYYSHFPIKIYYIFN